MKWLAWAVCLLGLLLAAPSLAEAQQVPPTDQVRLKRNYPNPFNPETTLPFSVPEHVFADGHEPMASLRIYNVLAQLVAIPILQGSGEPLDNIQLFWNGTGEYSAYWDGKIMGTDVEAPSGVYVYQLTVDNQRFSERMTIIK